MKNRIILNEQQQLELIKCIADYRYRRSGDEWWKKLSEDIDRKMKWWKK